MASGGATTVAVCGAAKTASLDATAPLDFVAAIEAVGDAAPSDAPMPEPPPRTSRPPLPIVTNPWLGSAAAVVTASFVAADRRAAGVGVRARQDEASAAAEAERLAAALADPAGNRQARSVRRRNVHAVVQDDRALIELLPLVTEIVAELPLLANCSELLPLPLRA